MTASRGATERLESLASTARAAYDAARNGDVPLILVGAAMCGRSTGALETLAYNLHWTWNHETIELFRRLDRDLWEETNHNPVQMLGAAKQDRLHQAARDHGFMDHLRRAHDRLHDPARTRRPRTTGRRSGAVPLPGRQHHCL